MPTLLPSGLVTWAGVTALEPAQPWVPWLEYTGAEGAGGRMCQQMSPARTQSAPSPLDGTTITRSRQALLHLSQAYCTQKMVDPLGSKSVDKGPSHQVP